MQVPGRALQWHKSGPGRPFVSFVPNSQTADVENRPSRHCPAQPPRHRFLYMLVCPERCLSSPASARLVTSRFQIRTFEDRCKQSTPSFTLHNLVNMQKRTQPARCQAPSDSACVVRASVLASPSHSMGVEIEIATGNGMTRPSLIGAAEGKRSRRSPRYAFSVACFQPNLNVDKRSAVRNCRRTRYMMNPLRTSR